MPQPHLRLGQTIFAAVFQCSNVVEVWGLPLLLQFSNSATLLEAGLYHLSCSFPMPQPCSRPGRPISVQFSNVPGLFKATAETYPEFVRRGPRCGWRPGGKAASRMFHVNGACEKALD